MTGCSCRRRVRERSRSREPTAISDVILATHHLGGLLVRFPSYSESMFEQYLPWFPRKVSFDVLGIYVQFQVARLCRSQAVPHKCFRGRRWWRGSMKMRARCEAGVYHRMYFSCAQLEHRAVFSMRRRHTCLLDLQCHRELAPSLSRFPMGDKTLLDHVRSEPQGQITATSCKRLAHAHVGSSRLASAEGLFSVQPREP